MSRASRARPVLGRQRHWLRKRYLGLLAAFLIPAIASAAEWPAAPSLDQERTDANHPTIRILLDKVPYKPFVEEPKIHSDTDQPTVTDDAIVGSLARPFVATGSEIDKARAEQCLTMAIYYEAASEPDDGQRAVAQVVLNRVVHPSYPNSVCGVVFQGSERSTGCQFTFACDGSLARRPMAFWWDRARRVAQAALSGFVFTPVGLATNYHTYYVHPAWDNSMVHVTTIGAHQFYRLPGAAGLRAAFHMAYSGDEPMAAPHPRALGPAIGSDPDPVALARAYNASLPGSAASQPLAAIDAPRTAAAPPSYSAEFEARGGDALFQVNNLPDGGGLSPELQRSGQWLQRP